MESIYLWLGVVAALLHGTAYIVYNWQVLTGQSQPKSASWSVWALLAALNAFLFRDLVVNWFSALQFFVGTVGTIGTFLVAWWYGKLKRPEGDEWWYLSICVVGVIVWKVFHSAEWASILVLFVIVASFKPTITAVWKNPFVDKVIAWWVWTSAFGITILNLALQNERPITFVMPVAMFLAHGSVAWLSRESRRRLAVA